MKPGVEELTHCSSNCGVNFHFSCLEEWKKTAPNPVKCPLCRSEWEESSLDTQILPYVDEDTFDMYIEWLYRKKILATSDEDVDKRCEHLVDAYTAGKYLEDEDFCNAVLHSILEACADANDYPAQRIVEMAYDQTDDTDESCALRELLVDIYKQFGEEAWPSKAALDDAPKEFLHDLCMSLFSTSSAHEDERPSAILRIAENLEPIEDTDDDEDEKHETNSSSG